MEQLKEQTLTLAANYVSYRMELLIPIASIMSSCLRDL